MFVYVCWGTVLLLMLLRWVFAIHFKVFVYSDKVWELLFAVLMPLPGILILLRSRTKKIVYDKPRARHAVLGFAFFTTLLMIVFSQNFMSSYFAKLQEVNRVEDIARYPRVRFYRIKQYQLALGGTGTYIDVSYSSSYKKGEKRRQGETNKKLNYAAYVVTPMMGDTTQFNYFKAPKYWLGLDFAQRFDYNIPEQEKELRFRELNSYGEQQAAEFKYERPDHFENYPQSYDEKSYKHAIGYKVNRVPEDYMVLRPVYRRFEDRTGNTLFMVFAVFGIGSVLFALLLTGGDFVTQDPV